MSVQLKAICNASDCSAEIKIRNLKLFNSICNGSFIPNVYHCYEVEANIPCKQLLTNQNIVTYNHKRFVFYCGGCNPSKLSQCQINGCNNWDEGDICWNHDRKCAFCSKECHEQKECTEDHPEDEYREGDLLQIDVRVCKHCNKMYCVEIVEDWRDAKRGRVRLYSACGWVEMHNYCRPLYEHRHEHRSWRQCNECYDKLTSEKEHEWYVKLGKDTNWFRQLRLKNQSNTVKTAIAESSPLPDEIICILYEYVSTTLVLKCTNNCKPARVRSKGRTVIFGSCLNEICIENGDILEKRSAKDIDGRNIYSYMVKNQQIIKKFPHLLNCVDGVYYRVFCSQCKGGSRIEYSRGFRQCQFYDADRYQKCKNHDIWIYEPKKNAFLCMNHAKASLKFNMQCECCLVYKKSRKWFKGLKRCKVCKQNICVKCLKNKLHKCNENE